MPKDKLKRLVGVTTEERFWHHVPNRPEDGCWEWVGAKVNGYGLFWDGTKMPSGKPRIVRAHRFSLSLVQEMASTDVDHICRNRSCVRPDHLRLATRAQTCQNLVGATRQSKSGLRGVHPFRGKWAVQVRHEGVAHYGGVFATIQEANTAAIALRNRLFTHNEADRHLVA